MDPPYRFLPSERTATTIEEFLEGCRAEPTLAADQLHQGYFESWLRDAGRPDLAEAAARVRQTDIASAPALEQFLQAATLAPPRRRRMRGRAGARAAGDRLPTHEEPLIDAAPNEATSPPVGMPDLARLAHHAEAAADAEAVQRFAPAAAAQAASVGAHREAAAQYARALRFAGWLLPAARAELLERQAHECYVTDGFSDIGVGSGGTRHVRVARGNNWWAAALSVSAYYVYLRCGPTDTSRRRCSRTTR